MGLEKPKGFLGLGLKQTKNDFVQTFEETRRSWRNRQRKNLVTYCMQPAGPYGCCRKSKECGLGSLGLRSRLLGLKSAASLLFEVLGPFGVQVLRPASNEANGRDLRMMLWGCYTGDILIMGREREKEREREREKHQKKTLIRSETAWRAKIKDKASSIGPTSITCRSAHRMAKFND